MRRIIASLRWLLFVALLPLPALAEDLAGVTLAEGKLELIRGAALFTASEGLRVRDGDIFATAEGGFALIEFADGTVVAMGPATRLMLLAAAPSKSARPAGRELVLLDGWLKAQTRASPDSSATRYASPLLGAQTRDGSLVLHVSAEHTELFVEANAAEIAEVAPDGRPRAATSAKAGQFFLRPRDKPAGLLPRPTPSFLAGLPRPFQDALPARLARLKDKKAEPRLVRDVDYADIADWMKIGQSWRKGFARRFVARLKDANFRQGVIANIKEHPEWDRILFPEKYLPKNVAAGRDGPPGR